MTNKQNSQQPRFEEAYQELTEIIDQLESGSLPLDESMALFERGRTLVLMCEKQLNEAELRVSQLLEDNNGSLRTELLD